MKTYHISIVGTGYVGLCTAVGFASRGYKVITTTHDEKKAEKINNAMPPFYEPNLQELLAESRRRKRLKCTLSLEDAVANTDITFITVGTPSRLDGSIDLQYIKRSATEIGDALKAKSGYHLVVVKSTVIPGTSDDLIKPLLERCSGRRCGTEFGLCMSPEFLRQGAAIHDTLNPDRVVIGEYDRRSGDVLAGLSRDFYGKKMPPLVRTKLATAEIIKYANNAFLATKISFVNTIANICQRIPGADIVTVVRALGLDKRINPDFLKAGLGYGGSCFPKDVKALTVFARDIGYGSRVLVAVESVNSDQPYQAVKLARDHLGCLEGKRIAILGLSFKPETDDMREARSVPVIERLLKDGASVVAYDPVAVWRAREIFGEKIHFASSAVACLRAADCCIIVTEWDEFKKLKPEDFKENMRTPILIDGRRIYDPRCFSAQLQFSAIGLGR
jgi:UDPglucose 6-dehydrogenase